MDATFNAWSVTTYGGPDVLHPVARPMPTAGPSEVRIKQHASAVTRADGMMRAGTPKFARLFLGWSKPKADLVGTCFSGRVVGAGDRVTRFAVGDDVFGEAGLSFGANATHICLDEDGVLMKKPAALSHEEAATLADGALTSWHFLRTVADLQPGERLLVIAGAGSLGSAAVQIAAAIGADVTASASGRNERVIRDLGAARFVDYTQADPLKPAELYDVVFDTIGALSFGQAKPALADGGRYMSPVLGLTLLKDMVLSKLSGGKRALFAAAGMQKAPLLREHLAGLLDLIDQQRFAPLMDRTYPLADLVEAHQYIETGHKRGNVVVVPVDGLAQ